MMANLDSREHRILVELLMRELSDLGPEIRHTDDRDYRDDLKERKQVVKTLLDRLETLQPA